MCVSLSIHELLSLNLSRVLLLSRVRTSEVWYAESSLLLGILESYVDTEMET